MAHIFKRDSEIYGDGGLPYPAFAAGNCDEIFHAGDRRFILQTLSCGWSCWSTCHGFLSMSAG
jgi:hypothetical protein